MKVLDNKPIRSEVADDEPVVRRKTQSSVLDTPMGPLTLSKSVGSGAALGVPAHRIRGNTNPLEFVTAKLAGLFKSLVSDDASIEANAAALEARAFDVLEVLTPSELGQAEAAFDAWFTDVETRSAAGEKLDAMEHLTLVHVLKTELFDNQDALKPYVARMQKTVEASHLRLTGKRASVDTVLAKRMPRRYLAKQSKEAQKIHAAIFSSKDDGTLSTLGDFAKNHVPTMKDPVIAVGILTALLTGTGAHLIAGAVHGYLLATLIEHVIHEKIGHATPKSLERLDKILSKLGPIGKSIKKQIEAMAFSHTKVHHFSYAGSYVDRFAPRDTTLPPEQRDAQREKKKAKIDQIVSERPPEEIEQIEGSDYGRKLAEALKSALRTAPVAAVATLVTGAIANTLGADVGLLFGVASVLTSLIFVPASNYLHPYLHMTREEAMSKAGPLMQAFLETDYVAHIAQAHYTHHRNARVNHNLVAGADYVLGYGASKVDTLVALRKMKTFY